MISVLEEMNNPMRSGDRRKQPINRWIARKRWVTIREQTQRDAQSIDEVAALLLMSWEKSSFKHQTDWSECNQVENTKQTSKISIRKSLEMIETEH